MTSRIWVSKQVVTWWRYGDHKYLRVLWKRSDLNSCCLMKLRNSNESLIMSVKSESQLNMSWRLKLSDEKLLSHSSKTCNISYRYETVNYSHLTHHTNSSKVKLTVINKTKPLSNKFWPERSKKSVTYFIHWIKSQCNLTLKANDYQYWNLNY